MRIGACLIAAGLAVLSFSAAQQASGAPVGYVAKSALINGDSVTTDDGIMKSGKPISLEQYAAERAGFKVTVVTGTQWTAMTRAQFAKYQLLIVGDPDCSDLPTSVTGNSSVWAPLVMGKSSLNKKVGNRTLVGTDPEDHYIDGDGGASPTDPTKPFTAGAEHLVESGIRFAGAVAGATGMYFDTSCDDNGALISTVNKLSAAGTGFSENTSPPCGGNVQLIAANPAFSALTDADIQGWQCSVHITFPTYPVDWQPLAVATDTNTHPTCGTDPITKTTACGEAYVLVSGQDLAVTSPDLTLTPTNHSEVSNTTHTHTVTATVTQVPPTVPSVAGAAPAAAAPAAATPVANQTVTFQITGTNAGVAGVCAPVSCKTNASGQVTFTYPDTNGVGNDTINASTDLNGTTEHATAKQTWTPAPPPPTSSTPTPTPTPSKTTEPIANTGTRTQNNLVLAGTLVGLGLLLQLGASFRLARGRHQR